MSETVRTSQLSPRERVAKYWSVLTPDGKMAAAASGIFGSDALIWGVPMASQEGPLAAGIVTAASVVAATAFAVRTRNQHKKGIENLCRDRYWDVRFADIKPLTYTNPKTSEKYEAPFLSTVEGNNGEDLGLGWVVGSVEKHFAHHYGDVSVVSLADLSDPRGEIFLLGTECRWRPVAPDFQQPSLEDVNAAADMPASRYLAQL